MARQTREEQFLGALLGMAIGDALGKPLRGMTAAEILETHGVVRDYIPVDQPQGSQVPAGEISDKSEQVLCIVESMTTNDGNVDVVNIIARLAHLASGLSQHTMTKATRDGIALASDLGGVVPDDVPELAELDVAARGIPVGLAHAVGGHDGDALSRDVSRVTNLSHRGGAQEAMVYDVAIAIARVARSEGVFPGDDGSPLQTAIERAGKADSFAEGIQAIVAMGGSSDALGAIGGAMLGARFGASGLPQPLIDGLDARIYLTMAAPWFYRSVMRRAGTVIDIRSIQ